MGLDPKIMEFYNDCGVSQIIGDKVYYQNKENFIEDANFDFSYVKDETFTVCNVENGYVKWYENPADACVAPLDIFEDGCYSFANEEEEGSFEVYIINIKK